MLSSPSPCEERAGRGLGRGARRYSLAALICKMTALPSLSSLLNSMASSPRPSPPGEERESPNFHLPTPMLPWPSPLLPRPARNERGEGWVRGARRCSLVRADGNNYGTHDPRSSHPHLS